MRGDYVWKIMGTVGSLLGTSKTRKGGWNYLGEKHQEVVVVNESTASSENNFYEDIESCMKFRTTVDIDSNIYFWVSLILNTP